MFYMRGYSIYYKYEEVSKWNVGDMFIGLGRYRNQLHKYEEAWNGRLYVVYQHVLGTKYNV